MIASTRQRGVTLLMSIIVTTLVGGLLTLLSVNAAHFQHDRQVDHVRRLTRTVADSAAAYARTHLTSWADAPPAEPIELDVQTLLPPRATGTATASLQRPARDSERERGLSVRRRFASRGVRLRAPVPSFPFAFDSQVCNHGTACLP